MSDSPSHSTNDSVYDRLAAAVRAERPVALATVIAGPGAGGKLLVGPDIAPLGSLGDFRSRPVVARRPGELARAPDPAALRRAGEAR